MVKVASPDGVSTLEVGVIGSEQDGVKNPDAARFEVAPSEVQLRPADNSPVGTTRESGFKKVEAPEAAQERTLPEGFEDWEGYKRANSSARDNFAQAIRFPGTVFVAPGTYADAQNIDTTYDVATDEIVPDGLYLIGTNYLTRRNAAGTLTTAAPLVQPDPLRKSRTKE